MVVELDSEVEASDVVVVVDPSVVDWVASSVVVDVVVCVVV